MGSFRQGKPGFGGGSKRSFGRDSRGGGGFNRGGGFGGGRRFGGGFGGRGRDNDRGPAQMYDATCSKCGKACQVPFKPTGSKPVLCSDCFRKNDSFGHNSSTNGNGSGASAEQIKQINAKLDMILKRLDELEITEDFDDEDEDSEEAEEESEESSEESKN